MNDSWSPRKLDPGLAAQYSIPRDLKTSVMKSEPGRALFVTSTAVPVYGFRAACCASAIGAVAAKPAAPAAPFRKPRRSTGFFDFSSIVPPAWVGLSRATCHYVMDEKGTRGF